MKRNRTERTAERIRKYAEIYDIENDSPFMFPPNENILRAHNADFMNDAQGILDFGESKARSAGLTRAKHGEDLRPDRAGRFRRPGLLPPDVEPGSVPRVPVLLPMRGREGVRDFSVLQADDGGGVRKGRSPEAGRVNHY